VTRTPPETTGPPQTSDVGRGLGLLCLAGVLWGTIGPGVHLVLDGSDLSVLTLGASRATAAVATLFLAALVTRRLRAAMTVAGTSWRPVVVVGVLTAAFQLLFFVAVVAAGVSVATMVTLGFAPVLLLVVTSVRERRRPRAGHLLTIATAVVGLALVSLVGTGSQTGTDVRLGVLASLAAGACYALSAEAASPLTRSHDALAVTTATMTVAAAVLVPAGLLAAYVGGEQLATTDPATWGLVLYLGVVTMALAYGLLFAGLRSTPPGTAVVATLIEPVAAVAIAVLWLGERLTLAGVLGSLLILGAIATLGRRTQPLQPQ
jgi:drug/metabolite transporter, DME family